MFVDNGFSDAKVDVVNMMLLYKRFSARTLPNIQAPLSAYQ